MKRIFFFLSMLFVLTQMQAQCIDSTQIRPYYQGCDRRDYHPVCACGKTYFNNCIATMEYGVMQSSILDGVCNAFDFAFFPNQFISGTSDQINFYIQFKKPDYNLAYLYIIDLYGARIYNRMIQTPFNTETFMIEESSGFRSGVYFVIVDSGGIYQTQKLVVIRAGQ